MRLFFAVTFPPEALRALAEYCDRLKAMLPGARFTREDLIHLTLYFAGEQPPMQADALARLLKGPLDCPPPFALRTGGLGAFRSGSGCTLWIGLSAHPNLQKLRDGLLKGLAAVSLPKAESRFIPHITLAREAVPDGPVTALESLCPPPDIEIPAVSLTLYESLRRQGMLTYRPLCVRNL